MSAAFPEPPSITLGDAQRLFDRHGLGVVHSLQPRSGGQINGVYLVNGRYILRLRPEEKKAGAFVTEETLFRRLRSRLPVPVVLACDTTRELLPVDYLVCARLPGDNLVRVWLTASERERRWLVLQLAEVMRALHEEAFPACGGFEAGALVPASSWRAYLSHRFQRRLLRVKMLPNADRDLMRALDACWRRHEPALQDRPPVLVHRDLHFGNLLVENHRISGVLDFEAAVAGPAEYELDQLRRFLHYPALFVEPELAPSVSPALFQSVWRWLREGYPELFAIPRLEPRLALYSLEYDLAALHDGYLGRWGAGGLAHVLERIRWALEIRS